MQHMSEHCASTCRTPLCIKDYTHSFMNTHAPLIESTCCVHWLCIPSNRPNEYHSNPSGELTISYNSSLHILYSPEISLSTRDENVHINIYWGNQNSKRHVYPNVHRSTVYNSQDMKQPRCLSADKWIRKLWYIYTMEYYSAIKNNTFESVLMRWMKLEPIIQSEISQKEKHQYSILLLSRFSHVRPCVTP